jgi:hypothetical protein
MPKALPPQPHIGWLKKTAKERLAELRARDASAKLHQAQLAVANDYGFPSWRALKARVDALSLDGQIIAAAKEGRAMAAGRIAQAMLWNRTRTRAIDRERPRPGRSSPMPAVAVCNSWAEACPDGVEEQSVRLIDDVVDRGCPGEHRGGAAQHLAPRRQMGQVQVRQDVRGAMLGFGELFPQRRQA